MIIYMGIIIGNLLFITLHKNRCCGCENGFFCSPFPASFSLIVSVKIIVLHMDFEKGSTNGFNFTDFGSKGGIEGYPWDFLRPAYRFMFNLTIPFKRTPGETQDIEATSEVRASHRTCKLLAVWINRDQGKKVLASWGIN